MNVALLFFSRPMSRTVCVTQLRGAAVFSGASITRNYGNYAFD